MNILRETDLTQDKLSRRGTYLVVQVLVTQNDDVPGRGILQKGTRGLVVESSIPEQWMRVLFPRIPGDVVQEKAGSYRTFPTDGDVEIFEIVGRRDWK